jgi:Peptidase A4 family
MGKTLSVSTGHSLGRWLRKAVIPAAALALVTCLTAAPALAAQTGTPGGQHSSAASAARQRAIVALLRKDRMGIPTATDPNWAGYVGTNTASAGDFEQVDADWNVPEIVGSACTDQTFPGVEQTAFWVGLDGDGDQTVEQTGTITGCDQGTPFYYAWYEMFPGPLVPLFSVNPGDHMVGAVNGPPGGPYTINIIDSTTGTSVHQLESCGGSSCASASAEVIAEAPGGCQPISGQQACRWSGPGSGWLYPMANFGWVNFHGVIVTSVDDPNPHSIGDSQFGPVQLTMVDGTPRTILEISSALSKDAFTATWEHAA